MRKWTKEHAKFIGRVIFANFLKLPLERYENIIKEAEQSIYHEGDGSRLVTVRRLSKVTIPKEKVNRYGETKILRVKYRKLLSQVKKQIRFLRSSLRGKESI